jgi:hypothetical protein
METLKVAKHKKNENNTDWVKARQDTVKIFTIGSKLDKTMPLEISL